MGEGYRRCDHSSGTHTRKSPTFKGLKYPQESDHSKSIGFAVSQQNPGTGAAKVNVLFGSIVELYSTGRLPNIEYFTSQIKAYLLNPCIGPRDQAVRKAPLFRLPA